MRAGAAACAALGLAWSCAAAAGPAPELRGGWQLHERVVPPSGPNAVACAPDGAFLRSWSGAVVRFDGSGWSTLPELPGTREGKSYGTAIAAAPKGEVYVEASGRIAHYAGAAWTMLELPGWRGPIGAIAVLGTGELVVVGHGRLGLQTGPTITSYDAGTWRELGAVGGPSLADLWTAGQGGTVMQRTSGGWIRMATSTTAWLSGLHRSGPRSAWAWEGDQRRGHRSTGAVLRWDGSRWTAAQEGLTEPIVGIGGTDSATWAATASQLLRWSGSAWTEELKASELGEGYHRFVGLCSTASALVVGDAGGHGLVRALAP